MEGVEAVWQVGSYLGEDLYRLREVLHQQRIRKALGLAKGKTSISLGVDATMITEDWSPIADEIIWSDYLPFISTLSINHRLEGTIFDDQTNLNLSILALAKRGNGNSIVSGSISRQLHARLRGRIDFSLGDQRRTGLGLSCSLAPRTNLDLYGFVEPYGGISNPAYQISVSQAWFDSFGSSISLLGGLNRPHGLVLGLNYVNPSNQLHLSTQFVEDSLSFAFKGLHQLDEHTSLKAKLSTSGPTLCSLGIVRRSPEPAMEKGSAALSLNTLTGVGVQFGYSLGDISFILPIYICREISTHSILMGAGLPSLFGLFLHNFILEPYKRWKRERRLANLRDVNMHLLEKQKTDALMAIDLMAPFYDRKVAQETLTNGLLILKASYETASPMGSPLEPCPPESMADVTIPLQMLVVDSTLYIPAGKSKAHLLGFYDVGLGEGKVLRVEYLFRGQKHCVTIADKAELLIPLKRHLIP